LEIHKSALIGHSAPIMFDLIEAAEFYPSFLPWCTNAAVLMRDEHVVVAQINISYHGLDLSFTTRNPKRRPHWMAIQLEEGPFRRFEGEWRLTELTADACKIEFSLRYELGGALVSKLASRVFEGIASSLIDAFANRAAQVAHHPQADRRRDALPPSGTTS
jgi:ribosome-associated toxin RatA of RatAB toxin-antitoxin module